MIEYTNGQFGAIAPSAEVLEMLRKLPTLDEVRAIHFGSPVELSEVRQGRSSVQGIHERLADIEKEITRLRPRGLIKVYGFDDMPSNSK